MNVGQAIKMCRTSRKVSQVDLANRAGCSVAYLSMLENNKRDPALSTIFEIAKALQVPIEILFFLAAEPGDLKGIDQDLSKELARTALELLREPLQTPI